MKSKTLGVMLLTLLLGAPLALHFGAGKSVEFGAALDTLQADAKRASSEVGDTTGKAEASVKAASENPSDVARQKNATSDVGSVVRGFEKQIETLDGDLRIVKAGGEALLDQVADRITKIQNPVVKRRELERLKVARERFERDLVLGEDQITELRRGLRDARDAVLVVDNSRDMAQLVKSSNDVLAIVKGARGVLASLESFGKDSRDMVAMGS